MHPVCSLRRMSRGIPLIHLSKSAPIGVRMVVAISTSRYRIRDRWFLRTEIVRKYRVLNFCSQLAFDYALLKSTNAFHIGSTMEMPYRRFITKVRKRYATHLVPFTPYRAGSSGSA